MTKQGIELFAGPGGMSEGVRMARPELDMLGIEWDKDACATAIAAGHQRVQADVTELNPHDYADRNYYFHASPPCQGFSLSGNGKGRLDGDRLLEAIEGMSKLDPRIAPVASRLWVESEIDAFDAQANDHRSRLTLEPLRWIAALLPTYISLEQVPSVLPIWEAYKETLEAWGYNVWVGVLHAEQFGVPQTRKRAILMASRVGPVTPPTPTHSRYYPRNKTKLDPGVKPWVSMAEALGRGMTERPSMTVTGGGTSTGGAEPFGNGARKGMLREQEAGAWLPTPTDHPGNTDWVYERPSPTIVGSFAPEVVAAPGYRKAGDPPRQNTPGSVRVTVEEAGVLQSFPREYPWQGTKGRQHQQVGDSVPPLLGEAIVDELIV